MHVEGVHEEQEGILRLEAPQEVARQARGSPDATFRVALRAEGALGGARVVVIEALRQSELLRDPGRVREPGRPVAARAQGLRQRPAVLGQVPLLPDECLRELELVRARVEPGHERHEARHGPGRIGEALLEETDP
jgi:hypothetical protein